MKKTLKVTIPGFELKSQWRYKQTYGTLSGGGHKGSQKATVEKVPTGWKLAYGPTSDTKTVKVDYSLPSGAKVKTSRVWAKISSGNSVSVCTVNGASFSKKDGSKKGANVKLTNTSGSGRSAIKNKIKALGLNGNVDLTKRPIVSPSTMKKAGYSGFDGSYATLFSMTYVKTLKNGDTYTLLVTPIMSSGKVLSQSEIDSYVTKLCNSSTSSAIKSNDTSGLLIYYVKGSHISDVDKIAVKSHDLSDEWENYKPSKGLSLTFKYRATGGLYKDEKTHTGTLKFDNVYLLIEYETSVEAAKTTPAKPKGFSVPPQTTCIYDQTDGSVYLFDGVTKVQHSLTLDIQEEPDNSKKEYVNNAKNLPDKVTIDVVMSDVYTGGGAIVNKAGKLTAAQNKALNKVKKSILQNGSGTTRSESAFRTLHSLKEKRRKLTVITPLFVYVDMVLASATTNQDDSTTFGWEGQITFQKAFKAKAKKKKKTSKDTGTNTPPDKAIFA